MQSSTHYFVSAAVCSAILVSFLQSILFLSSERNYTSTDDDNNIRYPPPSSSETKLITSSEDKYKYKASNNDNGITTIDSTKEANNEVENDHFNYQQLEYEQEQDGNKKQGHRIPAVIVVGTQKGGTTALREYLKHHPQMIASDLDEPHFFDNKFYKYLEEGSNVEDLSSKEKESIRFDYASTFFNTTKIEENPDLFAFEKTPKYIFHPYVANRVKTILPWSKIIMLLRDPVERAYSQFKMNYERYYYDEKITFEKCLQIDIRILKHAGVLPHETFWNSTYEEKEKRWLKYWKILKKGYTNDVCDAEIGRGLYSLQIQRWLSNYGQEEFRNKILTIRSESLLPDPVTKLIDLKVITDFIGVDEMNVVADKKIHTTGTKWGPMKNQTKVMLRNLFAPFNELLQSLLGDGWEDPWPYDDIL